MITADDTEDQRALRRLVTPPGQPGSGRVRYAAAMHFNRKGQLSDAALEVFRICSPLDGEDPAPLLAARGLGAEIPDAPAATGEVAVRGLLDEIDVYLGGLAGPGIAEARVGLGAWQGGPVTPGGGRGNAIIARWLEPALAQLRPTHPTLAAAIAEAAPFLDWGTFDAYPLDAIGRDFAGGHAAASIIGEAACIPALDWDMGLFLIAPHVLYRDHRHKATELYAPLTGPHGWRFGTDLPLTVLPAHRPVWNDPFVPHLTKVGPTPFLCIFAWTRDVNAGAEVVPASDWPALEALRLTA